MASPTFQPSTPPDWVFRWWRNGDRTLHEVEYELRNSGLTEVTRVYLVGCLRQKQAELAQKNYERDLERYNRRQELWKKNGGGCRSALAERSDAEFIASYGHH